MRYFKVAPYKSAKITDDYLTYSFGTVLPVGEIVSIEIRAKKTLGVVLSETKAPKFKTKEIVRLRDQPTVPKQLVDLALWISGYYVASLASVFRTMLPSGLEKKRHTNTTQSPAVTRHSSRHKLNKEQESALKKMSISNKTSLLHGVTGSGKTRIYIELAKKTIDSGESTIILVPEISLTAQIVGDFKNEFKRVFVTHSGMTEAEKHKTWHAITSDDSPKIVIGPRSALFAPLKKIGLVVVDECHDDSYKQEQSPRYNALKVARKLCDFHGAKLVLGSATPAVEDYYRAKKEKAVIHLRSPARTQTITNPVKLIDLGKQNNNSIFSEEFIEALASSLKKKQQALIFHNRRGTAPLSLCSTCGWSANCPNCFIPFTLHKDKLVLRCHTCSTTQQLPKSCPDCGNTEIVYKGFGTKQIEEQLKQQFPSKRIARFDTDTNKRQSLAARYQELYSGKIDIIIGTQMVSKGLDLPRLGFVGIAMADTGLQLPDFKTSERVFQLIHQSIGRGGRHMDNSTSLIQTYAPDNPPVKFGASQDYDSFYKWVIANRKTGWYPPFVQMLVLTCSYSTQSRAKSAAEDAARQIQHAHKGVQIVGPAPAFYERRSGRFRWQVLIKAKTRKLLLDIAEDYEAKSNWTVDIEPTSLLS